MWYYLSIFFFSFCFSISLAIPTSFQGVIFTTKKANEKPFTILKNNKTESLFDYYGLDGLTCSFPKVFEDSLEMERRTFIIENQRTDDMQPVMFTVEQVEAYSNNGGVKPIISGFKVRKENFIKRLGGINITIMNTFIFLHI